MRTVRSSRANPRPGRPTRARSLLGLGGGGGGGVSLVGTATSVGSQNVTLTFPEGTAEGDLLIVVAHSDNNAELLGISGFTELFEVVANTADLWVAYKVASAGDISTGSVVTTGATFTSTSACLAVYRNAGTPLPIASTTSIVGSGLTVADITTSDATSTYLLCTGASNDNGAFSYAEGDFTAVTYIETVSGTDSAAGIGSAAGTGGTLTPRVTGAALFAGCAAATVEIPLAA